tara:strand:+ start:468 stop:641 length:174 start_codon:yes stop_codon:yes gene_type:complete
MSTFSFIIAILMAVMSLAFTLLSISTGDQVAGGVGYILLIATGVFAIAGFVMLWRGE